MEREQRRTEAVETRVFAMLEQLVAPPKGRRQLAQPVCVCVCVCVCHGTFDRGVSAYRRAIQARPRFSYWCTRLHTIGTDSQNNNTHA